MTNALAPRRQRGCSWVWLALVLTGLTIPQVVYAQDAKSDAKKDKAADAAPEDTSVAEEPPKSGSFEIYKDPRAEQALEVFKSLPDLGRDFPPNQLGAIKTMAATSGNIDNELLQKFVRGMALQLINKANIEGVIAPKPGPPTSPVYRAIQVATDNLIEQLASARQAKNTAFLTAYNKELIATLPRLLDNNLVSRIEAMIVLAQTGSPDAIPVFVKQLKDKDQTIWVKMWAARGLTNVLDEGRKVDAMQTTQVLDGARALVDSLEFEKESPWPYQVRALEALGATRVAATPTGQAKAEMASKAMEFVSNADNRLEVRAAAAKALGLLRVNTSLAKYNFGLVGFNVGRLAADVGDRITATFSENPVQAEYLAGLLVGPIYQAFNGIDDARESGLLKVPSAHPAIGASKESIKQIADLEANIARTSAELVKSAAGLQKGKLKELGDRVAALKGFLDKNAPKDFHLVPGGPEFKVQAASGTEVAGDAGAK